MAQSREACAIPRAWPAMPIRPSSVSHVKGTIVTLSVYTNLNLQGVMLEGTDCQVLPHRPNTFIFGSISVAPETTLFL